MKFHLALPAAVAMLSLAAQAASTINTIILYNVETISNVASDIVLSHFDSPSVSAKTYNAERARGSGFLLGEPVRITFSAQEKRLGRDLRPDRAPFEIFSKNTAIGHCMFSRLALPQGYSLPIKAPHAGYISVAPQEMPYILSPHLRQAAEFAVVYIPSNREIDYKRVKERVLQSRLLPRALAAHRLVIAMVLARKPRVGPKTVGKTTRYTLRLPKAASYHPNAFRHSTWSHADVMKLIAYALRFEVNFDGSLSKVIDESSLKKLIPGSYLVFADKASFVEWHAIAFPGKMYTTLHAGESVLLVESSPQISEGLVPYVRTKMSKHTYIALAAMSHAEITEVAPETVCLFMVMPLKAQSAPAGAHALFELDFEIPAHLVSNAEKEACALNMLRERTDRSVIEQNFYETAAHETALGPKRPLAILA